MFEDCRWLNEPARWHVGPEGLALTTGPATDFWRETHYGFTRHSGHVFGREVAGGFTATLRIRANYQALYDQAGIMLLLDKTRWLKAGVEMSDGQAMLASVLTIGRSDWALGSVLEDPSDFWLRATLRDGVLRLQASVDGRRWPLLRLCPFPVEGRCFVGPMACTPERGGLEVRFPHFSVTAPMERELHDLS